MVAAQDEAEVAPLVRCRAVDHRVPRPRHVFVVDDVVKEGVLGDEGPGLSEGGGAPPTPQGEAHVEPGAPVARRQPHLRARRVPREVEQEHPVAAAAEPPLSGALVAHRVAVARRAAEKRLPAAEGGRGARTPRRHGGRQRGRVQRGRKGAGHHGGRGRGLQRRGKRRQRRGLLRGHGRGQRRGERGWQRRGLRRRWLGEEKVPRWALGSARAKAVEWVMPWEEERAPGWAPS